MRVAGEPIAFAPETDDDPEKIDHFWITIRAGSYGPIRIALSTYSRSNAAAGFDPRMRVGILVSNWSAIPDRGLFDSPWCDYAELEKENPVAYVERERSALEELLMDRSERALFIEAWGELYGRGHVGIHQFHSRRASSSVRNEIKGRDGAIRFYFASNSVTELFLFKYSGQS
jgi:hypothetical protein